MTASVYAFSASRYAVTSGLSLSRSQEYSSSRRSPWTTSVLGTRFASGGAGRIRPRLYLRTGARPPPAVRRWPPVELKLARSILRPWRVGDEDSLVRHANNRRVWRNLSRLPHPYTTADAHAWIARASAQSPVTDFAITVDGEAVGGIGVELGRDVFRRSAEIGYWLGEAYWGRGSARADRVCLRALRPLPPAGGRVRVEPGLDARAREGRLHAGGAPSEERHQGWRDHRSPRLRARATR